MRIKKLTGLILATRISGEFDRVVLVFSKEIGLTWIMAKGVRRSGSHRSFHMDLLNFSTMELEETGNGEKCTAYLREISTCESFRSIKENPEYFSAACLVASFLLRTLPLKAPQEKLFELTQKTLHMLNACAIKHPPENPAPWLFLFFLKAARQLGYMPKKVHKDKVRPLLQKVLSDLNPQFILQARRTLGIFSNFESIFSN